MGLDQERLDNALGLVGVLLLLGFMLLCMFGATAGVVAVCQWHLWAGIPLAVFTVLLAFGVMGYFTDWED